MQDAIQIQNAWEYCNYDDYDIHVGAFRDCTPEVSQSGQLATNQWTWLKSVRFSIFLGDGMVYTFYID